MGRPKAPHSRGPIDQASLKSTASMPKVAFGVNKFDAYVSTNHLRSPGDPFVSTMEKGTHFVPIGDFSGAVVRPF